MLEGYKTIIVAAVTILYGLMEKYGVLPASISVEDVANAIIALGTVFLSLRFVTKTPPGGGT
jgi:uncharacterized membrane-anchored protein